MTAIVENKYAFAKDIVLEAGEFLREHLHDELTIETKSHLTDLVTHLDKEVQERLVSSIQAVYPEDSIFAEESEERPAITKGNVWVIDPIDGTTNFVVQRAHFAILLAYFEEGKGQFACIYDVVADKLYHTGPGTPVFENNRVLPAYNDRPLHESLMGINTRIYSDNIAGLAQVADWSLGTRSMGSAGLSCVQVLLGELLLYVGNIYPWDYAAAGILGEKLGYSLMTTEGRTPSFDGREYVLFLPNNRLEEFRGYMKR